jgi:hypothetical protein
MVLYEISDSQDKQDKHKIFRNIRQEKQISEVERQKNELPKYEGGK